ncbi:MAG: TetR/AcrR family transcriptional regulator [Pseudomonadota bacterium]
MRDDEKPRDSERAGQGPGRPREFDEEEVAERMMSLFWEVGYEGAALSDIIAATGLQKGSLYKAFGGKRRMYLRALRRYESQAVDAAAEMLVGPGEPGRRLAAFLSAPIDAVTAGGDRRGCFLCNASADQAALDPETQAIVRRGFGKLGAALAAAVGEARPQWSAERIEQKAQLLIAAYSGLRVMARAGVAPRFLVAARDAALCGVAD